MTMIKLIAPRGTDECNYGTHRCRVDNDLSVWVDEWAVPPLLAVGGFRLANPPQPPIPAGDVKVTNSRDPAATVTVGGVTYEPDGGILTVPLRYLPDIRPHGFDVVRTYCRRPPA